MKRFWSNGRQVSFELPLSWQGEPDGTGMIFWDPKLETAALRLSVLTYRVPAGADPNVLPIPEQLRTNLPPLDLMAPLHWFGQNFELRDDDDGQFPFQTYYHICRQGEFLCIAIFTSSDFPPSVEQMIEHQVRQASLEV